MQLINELWITSRHFWSINDNVGVHFPSYHPPLPLHCPTKRDRQIGTVPWYWFFPHVSLLTYDLWKQETLHPPQHLPAPKKQVASILLCYVLKYFTEFYNYITFPFFSPSTSQLPLLKHFPCPTQVNSLFFLGYWWFVYICVYIYVYAQICVMTTCWI